MKIPHKPYPHRCACCRCEGHYVVEGRCRFCNKGRYSIYATIALLLFGLLVITWMLSSGCAVSSTQYGGAP